MPLTDRSARLSPGTIALLTVPPLLWAGNAVVGRMAAGAVAPFMLNFLRWLIAGTLLLPFAWRDLQTHGAALRASWRSITLMGVTGVGIYNAFQYLALTTSTPINVTLVGASGPVFVLSLGALFFGQRVTTRQMLGALISIVGVLWVMLRGEPDRLARLAFAPGDLFMLVATLSWSFYTWLLRTRRPDIPLPALLWAQIFSGLMVLLPFVIAEAIVRNTLPHWDARTGWILVYVGLFPSLLGYFFWDRGVARAGAPVAVFFVNLTPPFAALISTFMLAEAPEGFHATGLALILAGIWLVSAQPRAAGTKSP